jgi:hypothetical protein
LSDEVFLDRSYGADRHIGLSFCQIDNAIGHHEFEAQMGKGGGEFLG